MELQASLSSVTVSDLSGLGSMSTIQSRGASSLLMSEKKNKQIHFGVFVDVAGPEKGNLIKTILERKPVNVSAQQCQSLSSSSRKCLTAVTAAKGDPSKY